MRACVLCVCVCVCACGGGGCFGRAGAHTVPDDGAVAAWQDANLRHTLQFGIGLHHAGLVEGDRDIVEALFVGGQLQVHSTHPSQLCRLLST